MKERPRELERVAVSGTPRALGEQQGEALRERIRAFVAMRYDAARTYFAERGGPSVDRLTEAGAACLRLATAWDPSGSEEHRGIATAAGVGESELYAAANMTDVRDVVLLGSPVRAEPPDPAREGCTALVIPHGKTTSGELLAGQTWDLNPPDVEFVVAVHRRPLDAPETWSVTCVGCLSLMGMNGEGLAFGTTNLKVRGSRPGVGYLSLLHRAAREQSPEQAAHVVEAAPRAAAHSYWFAGPRSAVELECSAWSVVRRELGAEGFAHTNHCLAPQLCAEEGETPLASSRQRLRRAAEALTEGGLSVDGLCALFADRRDGVESISRFAEDGQGTATNAVLVAVPARRLLLACRGPARRGAWEPLAFARAGSGGEAATA